MLITRSRETLTTFYFKAFFWQGAFIFEWLLKFFSPGKAELEMAELLATRVISTVEFLREKAKDRKFQKQFLLSECHEVAHITWASFAF
jgi:high-affinity Fe2+/Pb2+ permease